jgi:hypothetical protein
MNEELFLELKEDDRRLSEELAEEMLVSFYNDTVEQISPLDKEYTDVY